MKKTIERTNMIFDAVVKVLIAPFRDTAKQASHFLDPHDPNDFEEEIIGMVVALYEEACFEFHRKFGRQSFSADKIHRLMVRRSSENPSCMHFHNYLGFCAVYFILRDAEKCNYTDLYFGGLRLVLPLFTASHAIDYVRICHELLIWRAKASEADLCLFQEYCFTCITNKGKFIFMDKGQEKVNGYLRDRVSNVWQPGYENKLINTCMNLEEKLRMKHSFKSSKGLR